MVEKLVREDLFRIIGRFLEGKRQKDIADEFRINESSTSEIISDFKSHMPDLEGLISLRKSLKSSGLKQDDAIKNLPILTNLLNKGITDGQLSQINLLLDKEGVDTSKVLDAAYRLYYTEKASGRTYNQQWEAYNMMTKELKEWDTKILNSKVTYDNLNKSIREQEKLLLLQSKLDQNEITIARMDQFIATSKKLEELGFTGEVANTLAQELKGVGLDPKTAAADLASLLVSGKNLQITVYGLRKEEKEYREKIQTANETLHQLSLEKANMNKTIGDNNQHFVDNKRAYEEEIKKLSSKKKRLIEDIAAKETTLASKSEILKAVDTKMASIEKEIAKKSELVALVSLMETPNEVLDRNLMLEVVMTVLNGFRTNIESRKDTALLLGLGYHFEKFNEIIKGELRDASK